jgi:glutaredoxin 3
MITVYSKYLCIWCDRAKAFLKNNGIKFKDVNVMEDKKAMDFIVSQGHRTLPQIYHNDKVISGGYTGLTKLKEGKLEELKNDIK